MILDFGPEILIWFNANLMSGIVRSQSSRRRISVWAKSLMRHRSLKLAGICMRAESSVSVRNGPPTRSVALSAIRQLYLWVDVQKIAHFF